MKIKRIIAREGLIIIGALAILAVVFLMNEREHLRMQEYDRGAVRAEIIISPSGVGSNVLEGSKSTDIYIMYPKIHDAKKLDQNVIKDFPNINNPNLIIWDDQSRCWPIKKYYDANGKAIGFTNYSPALALAFLLYPGYLLVRFIWWAIQTLTKKPSPS